MNAQANPPSASASRPTGGSSHPRHPDDAVRWLAGTTPARVLVLDAGAQLTAQLGALGHDVVATVPSVAAVGSVAGATPDAHPSVASPKALPLAAGSVDVVVVEDSATGPLDLSPSELARVLRPGGVVATIHTAGDRKVPWVKKVYALAGSAGEGQVPSDDLLSGTDLFELDDTHEVRHWETFRRDDVVGFVTAHPRITALDPATLEQLGIAAEELYDGYGRGPDGLLMPWLTSCRRAKVAGLSRIADDEPTERIAVPAAPTDDGLLIDFR